MNENGEPIVPYIRCDLALDSQGAIVDRGKANSVRFRPAAIVQHRRICGIGVVPGVADDRGSRAPKAQEHGVASEDGPDRTKPPARAFQLEADQATARQFSCFVAVISQLWSPSS